MTRRWRRSILVGLALLVLLGPVANELSTDWLWFGETGHQSTFLRILTSRGVLGIAAMALAFLVLFVNMRLAMRGFSPRQLVFLVLAFGAYLDVPQIPHSPGGVIHGATNVDVAVRIPALRMLMAAALVAAALLL